jgi:fructose-bisphosphate aldolase, class II
MQPLVEVLKNCKRDGTALGHFNFSDSNQLRAIARASMLTGLPVVAGLSEGEREYFPLAHARKLIDAYRAEGIAIYLNADHTYGLDKAQEAIDAGVDSIVVDGAKLPLRENIKLVTQVVAYAHSRRRFWGHPHEVMVEGELGYIGQSSKLHDDLPEGVVEGNLTTSADAQQFIHETGAACLAPAVGNVHGMLKSATEPRLHPDRVKEIAAATHVPLVLHGASGNTEDDISACIRAGVAMVHINTELRLLYRDSLRDSLKAEETTPYKFLDPAVEKMTYYIAGKMKVFARI